MIRLAGLVDKYTCKAGDRYPPQTHIVNRGSDVVVEEPTSEFWADEVVGIDDLIHDTQEHELTLTKSLSSKLRKELKKRH